MATQIFNRDGFLNFSEGALASLEDFKSADRCIGSIFDESLEEGEMIELAEGIFVLDEDLDPQQQ